MHNGFTVDVEDWFCVHNFDSVIPFSSWPHMELRIEQNVDVILALLKKYGTKATFFVLGWIAEQNPRLIRRIEKDGHELASHGYAHRIVKELTSTEFESDLARSLEILAKCSSQKIRGFRAPSFSVTKSKPWIFEILAKHGIVYDSSIYPVAFHPDYANAGVSLGMHRTLSGIIEVPMSCFRLGPLTLPCSGGGYFRLFPYQYTALGLRRCNHEGRPAVFYIHPWELDSNQPRVQGVTRMKRFRHYTNLRKTRLRLERLLRDFQFTSLSSLVRDFKRQNHL